MPTVTQKHENEVQAAFNRGRESANIDNLSVNFKEHEKYDNIRFDQLKSGLKDNCDATNCVVEKIDSLILITKTRNEVAVEAADNAAKIAENNLTTKKLYIEQFSLTLGADRRGREINCHNRSGLGAYCTQTPVEVHLYIGENK